MHLWSQACCLAAGRRYGRVMSDLRHVLQASCSAASAVQAQPDRGTALLDAIMRCVGSLQGMFSHARVVGQHIEYDSMRWQEALHLEVCFDHGKAEVLKEHNRNRSRGACVSPAEAGHIIFARAHEGPEHISPHALCRVQMLARCSAACAQPADAACLMDTSLGGHCPVMASGSLMQRSEETLFVSCATSLTRASSASAVHMRSSSRHIWWPGMLMAWLTMVHVTVCHARTAMRLVEWSSKRCSCCVVSPLHQASAATQSWARAVQVQTWFCFIHPLLANLSRVDPANKGTMRASLAVSLSHFSQPSQAVCYDDGSDSSTLRPAGTAALTSQLVWPGLMHVQ